MLIKIKGITQEHFNDTLTRVMNLAWVSFRRGNLPTEMHIQEPKRTGLYWYENTQEDRFELVPTLNNHKAFIRDRGEDYITIEFYSRYDRDKKEVNALSNLVLVLFDEDEVELVS